MISARCLWKGQEECSGRHCCLTARFSVVFSPVVSCILKKQAWTCAQQHMHVWSTKSSGLSTLIWGTPLIRLMVLQICNLLYTLIVLWIEIFEKHSMQVLYYQLLLNVKDYRLVSHTQCSQERLWVTLNSDLLKYLLQMNRLLINKPLELFQL